MHMERGCTSDMLSSSFTLIHVTSHCPSDTMQHALCCNLHTRTKLLQRRGTRSGRVGTFGGRLRGLWARTGGLGSCSGGVGFGAALKYGCTRASSTAMRLLGSSATICPSSASASSLACTACFLQHQPLQASINLAHLAASSHYGVLLVTAAHLEKCLPLIWRCPLA